MESTEYKKQYGEYLARAEEALNRACERYLPEESEVCRAARYSLMGGGKRIRAVLVLAVCDMLHGSAEAAEQFAAAVEMLHCYSLIHDDLPCMDNDDMRRGQALLPQGIRRVYCHAGGRCAADGGLRGCGRCARSGIGLRLRSTGARRRSREPGHGVRAGA